MQDQNKLAGVISVLTVTALAFGTVDADSADTQARQSGTGSTLTVGPDADCDYSELQAAMDDADDGAEVLVAESDGYTGQSYDLINKGLTIRGGFDECDPAADPSGRTVLDADGQAGRAFNIWLPSSESGPMDVVLENLEIRGGDSPDRGGGLRVDGRQGSLSVELNNVSIEDNSADQDGGGLAVRANADADGPGTILLMDNESQILDNESGGMGGGLACTNPDNQHEMGEPLIRLGNASIDGNEAEYGGGMGISNCRGISVYGGGPIIPGEGVTGAISNNVASEAGGGMHVEGVSSVFVRGRQLQDLGDDDFAAMIALNEAPLGGGIHATGEQVELHFSDLVLDENSADFGAGLYITDGAEAEMVRPEEQSACEPEQTVDNIIRIPRCSRARNNSASNFGGAFLVEPQSELLVERTIISGNDADLNGAVVRVRSDDPVATAEFRDVLVHDNSGTHLFDAQSNSNIDIGWSTITENDVTGSVIRGNTSTTSVEIQVYSSIIWEEETADVLFLSGGGDLTALADCVIGHQDEGDTDFTETDYYTNVNPQLLEEHEDQRYYPGPSSPAIDFCDDFNAEDDAIDLVGVERGSPHEGPPIVEPPSGGIGDYDIGAYETEWEDLEDEIFEDRFEEEDD